MHQNRWSTQLSLYAYTESFMANWLNTDHTEDQYWPDYENALNAYLTSQDTSRSLTARYASLVDSRNQFQKLIAQGDTHLATRLALIRIHFDLGEHQASIDEINQTLREEVPALLDALPENIHIATDRPFLAPLSTYDTQPVESDLSQWLKAAISNALESCTAVIGCQPLETSLPPEGLPQVVTRKTSDAPSVADDGTWSALTSAELVKKADTLDPQAHEKRTAIFLKAIGLDRNCIPAYLRYAKEQKKKKDILQSFLALKEAERLAPLTDEYQEMLDQLKVNQSEIQTYLERAGKISIDQSNTPKKILVITNLFPPQEMGGFGRTMWEFCQTLIERGHSLYILTADMPHLYRKPSKGTQDIEHVVKRDLRLYGDWKDGKTVTDQNPENIREKLSHNHRRILAEVKQFRPDGCLVGNLDFLGYEFIDVILEQGIPVVHRLGNSLPGYPVEATPKSPLYCMAGASEWLNMQLRSKGYSFANMAVIYPASTLETYYRYYPPAFDPLRICFSGLLMPYKGAQILVQALAELQNCGIPFTCELAGDTTDPYFVEQLSNIAQREGFANRLRFTGFLSRQELAALYARSNVMVFPSLVDEAFGKSQIEAMAAGLAVITSGTGGAREIITDGMNGWIFERGNAKDLAAKLLLLHRHPDQSREVAIRGHEDAFRFNTNRSVENLELIFDLLESKRNPKISQEYYKKKLDFKVKNHSHYDKKIASLSIKTPALKTAKTALAEKLESLKIQLPSIKHTHRDSGEIDFYGTSDLIAKALGLNSPLYTGNRISWMHGWGPLWSVIPELTLRFVEEGGRKLINLVITEEQANFLRSHGHNSIAVGSPFIYADQKNIERIPNSLLIMPPHSTTYSTMNAKNRHLPYVNYVSQFKDKFDLVVACIGGSDVLHGNWIHAFEEAQIPWICGAWVFDRNAWIRMQLIFRSFEYVTTNNLGSHIPYAAYSGAKIFVAGENNECTIEDILQHPFYKNNPDVADACRRYHSNHDFLKENFPFLFDSYDKAKSQKAWGEKQLGRNNKKNATEIAKILGWNLKDIDGVIFPSDPLHCKSNMELVDEASRLLSSNNIDSVFVVTNEIKRRHLKLENVDLIRGLAFFKKDNIYHAREAIKEELRHFPNNNQAKQWIKKIGGGDFYFAQLVKDGLSEFDSFLKTVRPFTRLSNERARSLYELACQVCKEDLPGDFVECGVAAGGSTMLLALVIKAHSKRPRKVIACDTFTGMPDPGIEDTLNGKPADLTGWGTGTCSAPEDYVRENCMRINVGEIVETHKGLFEETLPTLKKTVGTIALLHMDGDWYSSTKAILENLFDNLHPNALIQIDDYGAWDGCRKAIQEFEAKRRLKFDLNVIDDTGRWMRNPKRRLSKIQNFPQPFLNPKIQPDFADLYVVRSSILKAIKSVIPLMKGNFLDIGCGIMPYRSLILSESRVTNYIGLDIETNVYAAEVDLRWDGKTIPLRDDSIECAMATEVLEHCPEPLLILKEVQRVIKPGGMFFFTVPFVWPLHDTPNDYYRYTPFSLEKLLKDAGFEDISIQATGGWDASLAQMIGLWLKRSPMTFDKRNAMAQKLWPFYQQLLENDEIPTNPKEGNTMTTGWSGVAFIPNKLNDQEPEISKSQFPIALVRSHQYNYSETFIEDHVNFLSENLTLIYGFPFPRFVEKNQSILSQSTEKNLVEAMASGSGISTQLWDNYSQELAIYLKASKAKVVLLESGLMASFFYRACEMADLPYVVHFHGVDAFGKEILSQWKTHYKNFFRTASKLIVVSQAMREQLIRLGASLDKIVLAPYGVSVNLSELASPANAPPQFVAVGRFVDKKAPQLTLQAFSLVYREIPNSRLIMVGDGPLLKLCQQWVNQNGLSDAVIFAGVQTRRIVSSLMASSRAFVQHSLTASNGDSEGLPLAILEAGAHGLPVVSTRHAGIPDAVLEGKHGFLVDEGDIQGMSKSMLLLANDPDLAGIMGLAYRKQILEHFSRKMSIGRLQHLLSSLIS